MRYSQNSTIRRIFTAFFAFVTLFGQGLHFLPGLGDGFGGCHDCCHTSTQYSARHSATGGCSHHHQEAIGSGHDEKPDAADAQGSGWRASPGDSHDCPICQFMALAQLGAPTTQQLTSTMLWPGRQPELPEIFSRRESFEPHTPRGPPVPSAVVS